MAGIAQSWRRPFLLRDWSLTTLLLAAAGVVSLPPVVFILVNSFNTSDPAEPFTFGLDGWVQAFGSARTLNAIGYSFLLNIRTVIGIGIAFLLSWLLVRVRVPFRGFIELSLWIAYFLPALPLAISWILLSDPNYGVLNQLLHPLGITLNPYSVTGIIWVHLTASTIPIMTILLAPAMRQLDASLEEAARVCGLGPWRTFRYVLVPVLAPSLLTVWLAGMIRGLESFQVELLLGRPANINVFATRIYDLISWEPPEFAQAITLSTFFLGLLFVLALFYQQYTGRRQYATLSGRGVSFRQVDMGSVRYVVGGALLLAVFVAVYLPICTLILGSCMTLFGYFDIPHPYTFAHWQAVIDDPVFITSVWNSLVLGISTAVLAVIIYCLFGLALVRTRIKGRTAANVLLWLPWAVPGILSGLGFLWIFLSVPFLVPLYGTLMSLIWVLVVKEVPIGVHLVKTSFTQISEELEQAARVCGCGWFYTLRRITVPLIAPTLIAIFVIVFITAIRDVDNVILLAGASTRPLAVLMMEHALGGQFESASIISVILAFFAVTVALLMRRFGNRMEM
jgi:iron(III) transport system permease protein